MGVIGKIGEILNFRFFLYGRWEDLDRWKLIVFDVGVILDTHARHSETFFFRHFSEMGGGPLGQTSGCHQNLGIFRHFWHFWGRGKRG